MIFLSCNKAALDPSVSARGQGVIWVDTWCFQDRRSSCLASSVLMCNAVFSERASHSHLFPSFPQRTDLLVWWPPCTNYLRCGRCRPHPSEAPPQIPELLPLLAWCRACLLRGKALFLLRTPRTPRLIWAGEPLPPHTEYELADSGQMGSYLIRCSPIRWPSHPSASVTGDETIPPTRAWGGGRIALQAPRQV